MQFEEFTHKLMKDIASAMPEVKVSTQLIKKLDEDDYTGIRVEKKGLNKGCLIDADWVFCEMNRMKKTYDQILRVVLEHVADRVEDFPTVDEDMIIDFQKAKKMLFIHLVNREKNVEALKDIPHRLIHDFAIVCKLLIDENEENTTTTNVTYGLLEKWGIGETELFDEAVDNSQTLRPAVIKDFAQMMFDEYGVEDVDGDLVSGDNAAYVVTTKAEIPGAVALFYPGILKKVSNRFGSDVYCLPASVHEFICVSAKKGNQLELKTMVKEINETAVEANEVLSDNVYKYHRNSGYLEML